MSTCLVALLIEGLLGYPAALFTLISHPVTWIGALIGRLDEALNDENADFGTRRRNGALALAVVLIASGGGAASIQVLVFLLLPPLAVPVVLGLLASSCLAQRSLFAHVRHVETALRISGLAEARRAVAMIVGRDTAVLDEAGIARAAIESLAENFADGIVAPTFWLASLGLPGGVLYKAINTADSMIGHRTPRHAAFGFASAKLDDAVNWPAARLAALWIVAAAAVTPGASAANAWRIMRRDARGHASPNAGWPEAAMAGALGVRLGGARIYAGRLVEDASMGDGDKPTNAATIVHALSLYRRACGVNIAVVGLLVLLIAPWR